MNYYVKKNVYINFCFFQPLDVTSLGNSELVGLKLYITQSATSTTRSWRKKRKMRLQKPYTRFVCGNIISNMLKALLYECYARKGAHRRWK